MKLKIQRKKTMQFADNFKLFKIKGLNATHKIIHTPAKNP